MYISIGSFELKQKRWLPMFLRLSKKILKQAQHSEGNIHAEVASDGIRKFYSFTCWEQKSDMIHFVHKDAHAMGLEKTKMLCKKAELLYFEHDAMMTLETAKALLKTHPNKRIIEGV